MPLHAKLKCRYEYTVVFPAKSGSAKISNHAAMLQQVRQPAGRPTGSNTFGFTPALSGHSWVTGDQTGRWLAGWLAGRPGKPSSGCWLASRSPAEFGRVLCNRPASSRLISNQPATGLPSCSNRLENLISCTWAGSGWQSAGQPPRQEGTADIVGLAPQP